MNGATAARPGGEWGLLSTMAWLWRQAGNFLQKRKTRRALLDLTDEQLHDLGISRRDAMREGYRPFWD
ncbi:DUF1127 domain-containing protein [Nitratireductor pacificus]|uniref:YjiS-like domain-containing protein n=1 Tax=Nitratireductor pacificus pht-3B TaxID=391937 RepID=K2LPU1_9HYPH|nr:DUF1127 domain-containing protein [Nitratireductor pacificus]EKF19694.1 hypothetical protein NA2_07367 [Nitratireductor pacificus pht-3B]